MRTFLGDFPQRSSMFKKVQTTQPLWIGREQWMGTVRSNMEKLFLFAAQSGPLQALWNGARKSIISAMYGQISWEHNARSTKKKKRPRVVLEEEDGRTTVHRTNFTNAIIHQASKHGLPKVGNSEHNKNTGLSPLF